VTIEATYCRDFKAVWFAPSIAKDRVPPASLLAARNMSGTLRRRRFDPESDFFLEGNYERFRHFTDFYAASEAAEVKKTVNANATPPSSSSKAMCYASTVADDTYAEHFKCSSEKFASMSRNSKSEILQLPSKYVSCSSEMCIDR
jgi:hypothetical protein